MAVIEIGAPKWTSAELRVSFEQFKDVYTQKPVHDNVGGMKAPHAFAAWFMMKTLQPKTIIESGVWKGQGTWLFEQACPSAKIICLDVNFSNLIYKSEKARYIEKDFSLIDFEGVDKDSTICFFDDHQNALHRLTQMKWKGFKTAIFEDNYPAIRGDCYSLKKIFACAGFETEKTGYNGVKHQLKEFLQRIAKSSLNTVEANSTHKIELINNLNLYYEFPPLFKEEKTRWGDAWSIEDYPTKEPIFDSDYTDALRNEALHYSWMSLVELK